MNITINNIKKQILEYKQQQDWVNYLSLGNDLANAYSTKARFQEAANLLNELESKIPLIDDPKKDIIKVNWHSNWGYYYSNLGFFKNALSWHELAQKYAIAHITDPYLLAKTSINLGRCWTEFQEFDKASRYFEIALSHIDEVADFPTKIFLETATNINLAFFYSKKMGKEKQLDFAQKSVGLIEQYKDETDSAWKSLHSISAFAFNNLGHALVKNEEYTEALLYYRQTLPLWENTPQELAKLYLNIGDCYGKMSNPAKQYAYYQKGLETWIYTSSTENPNITQAFYKLAAYHLQQQEYEIALVLIQESIKILIDDFSDDNVYHNPTIQTHSASFHLLTMLSFKAEILINKFEHQHKLVDLKAGLSTYFTTMEVIDHLLKGLRMESSRFSLAHKTRDIFDKALSTLEKYGDKLPKSQVENAAYQFMERSHAASLKLAISHTIAKVQSDISPTLKAKEHKLFHSFIESSIQLQRANTDSMARLKEKHLYNIRALERLIENMEQTSPNYYKLKYETGNLLDLPILQKKLPKNTSILMYFIAQKDIFVLVISKDQVHLNRNPKPENFKTIIKDFSMAISEIDFQAFKQNVCTLYDLLIEPIEQNLSKKERLIIVPDDLLQNLPFEALVKKRQNDDALKYHQLAYLVKDFEISYHYSSTLLMQYTQPKKKVNWAKKLLGVVPLYENGMSYEGIDIKPLIYSKAAADQINSLFSNAQILWQNRATEQNVNEYIQQNYQYVWISGHGYFDKNNPDLTGFLLYGDDEETTALFPTRKVYNLQLNSELVVLDSCHSGQGKLVQGEGLMGLNRAFFHSGVPNIIFTDGLVSDHDSSEMISSFFTLIKKEKTYSGALTDIKRERCVQAKHTPLDWAKHMIISTL